MHAQAVTCYLDSDSDSIVIISLQHDIMFQYKQHYIAYCLKIPLERVLMMSAMSYLFYSCSLHHHLNQKIIYIIIWANLYIFNWLDDSKDCDSLL